MSFIEAFNGKTYAAAKSRKYKLNKFRNTVASEAGFRNYSDLKQHIPDAPIRPTLENDFRLKDALTIADRYLREASWKELDQPSTHHFDKDMCYVWADCIDNVHIIRETCQHISITDVKGATKIESVEELETLLDGYRMQQVGYDVIKFPANLRETFARDITFIEGGDNAK